MTAATGPPLLRLPGAVHNVIVQSCSDGATLRSLRLAHPTFSHSKAIRQALFATKVISPTPGLLDADELDLGRFQDHITHAVLRSVSTKDHGDHEQEFIKDSFTNGFAQYRLCNALRRLQKLNTITIEGPLDTEDCEHIPDGNTWLDFALLCMDDARLQPESLSIDLDVLSNDECLIDGLHDGVPCPTVPLQYCKSLRWSVRRHALQNSDDDPTDAIATGRKLSSLLRSCSQTLEELPVLDYGLIAWPSIQGAPWLTDSMAFLTSVAIHHASLDPSTFGPWISGCRNLSRLELSRVILWTAKGTNMSLAA